MVRSHGHKTSSVVSPRADRGLHDAVASCCRRRPEEVGRQEVRGDRRMSLNHLRPCVDADILIAVLLWWLVCCAARAE